MALQYVTIRLQFIVNAYVLCIGPLCYCVQYLTVKLFPLGQSPISTFRYKDIAKWRKILSLDIKTNSTIVRQCIYDHNSYS